MMFFFSINKFLVFNKNIIVKMKENTKYEKFKMISKENVVDKKKRYSKLKNNINLDDINQK